MLKAASEVSTSYLNFFHQFLNPDLSLKLSTLFDNFSNDPSKGFQLFGIRFNINFKKLDIGKYIPGIDEIEDYVWSWVKSVNNAFFWLYDQVIGHSWIPDLVEGINSWMGVS